MRGSSITEGGRLDDAATSPTVLLSVQSKATGLYRFFRIYRLLGVFAYGQGAEGSIKLQGNETRGDWRGLYNEELLNMHFTPNITRGIKSRMMICGGYLEIMTLKGSVCRTSITIL
jgi:hypothetical protein